MYYYNVNWIFTKNKSLDDELFHKNKNYFLQHNFQNWFQNKDQKVRNFFCHHGKSVPTFRLDRSKRTSPPTTKGEGIQQMVTKSDMEEEGLIQMRRHL